MLDEYPNKLSIAVNATLTLFNTSSPEDLFGFIVFSNEAQLFSDKLLNMNSENYKLLETFLRGLKGWGNTNYEKAFNLAFSFIRDN